MCVFRSVFCLSSAVSRAIFCNMGGGGMHLLGSLFPGIGVATHKHTVGLINGRRSIILLRSIVSELSGCAITAGRLSSRIVMGCIGRKRLPDIGTSGTLLRNINNGIVATHAPGRELLIRRCRGGSLLFTVNPTNSKGACATVTLTIETLEGGRIGHVVLDHPTIRTNRGLNFLPNSVGSGVSPCLRPLCSTLRSVVPPSQLTRLVTGGIIRVTPLTFVHNHALGSTVVVLSRTRGASIRRVGVFLAHLKLNSGVVIANSVARVSLPPRRGSNLHSTVRVLRSIGNVNFIRFGRGSVIHRHLIRHVIRTCGGGDRPWIFGYRGLDFVWVVSLCTEGAC